MLLMAKGFINGGWLFSVPCIVLAGFISGVCAARLIETRKKVRGSFSEIATYTFGIWGRILADFSLAVAQLSFVLAYVAFIILHV